MFTRYFSNTDVSAISDLKSLTYLDISHNRINSLTPLSSMRSLKTLRCNNNNLVDMEVMSKLLSLEELWLNNNQIGTVLTHKQISSLLLSYVFGFSLL